MAYLVWCDSTSFALGGCIYIELLTYTYNINMAFTLRDWRYGPDLGLYE
jgi:hypothetical protein